MFLKTCIQQDPVLFFLLVFQADHMTYYKNESSDFTCNKYAAAKSLQSCLTLCDAIDSSPPGFPVPGILQARTLEWVAISFSNAWKWKAKVKSLSCAWLFAALWTATHQAPPPMGFSGQKYWSGVPLPSLHATSIVFDKIPSCLDINFGLVGSTGNQFIIIDVLACLYQSCSSLRMFRREIFFCVCVCVCVCMFSLQVLNFQGEKCSAWANMTNNCEMFICKQSSVGSTESKAEIITLEKCCGI